MHYYVARVYNWLNMYYTICSIAWCDVSRLIRKIITYKCRTFIHSNTCHSLYLDVTQSHKNKQITLYAGMYAML